MSEAVVANVWSRTKFLCLSVADFVEKRVERLGPLKIAGLDLKSEFSVKHYCYVDVADLNYVCPVLVITDHFLTIW